MKIISRTNHEIHLLNEPSVVEKRRNYVLC